MLMENNEWQSPFSSNWGGSINEAENECDESLGKARLRLER